MAVVVAMTLALGACGGVDLTDAGPDEVAGEVAVPASEAALREKVQGKTVSVASAGFTNPTFTTMHKTLEILNSDFGVKSDYRVMDSSPMNAALISGQIQIGHVSIGGMLGAIEAGAPLVAIGVNSQKNAYEILAKAPIAKLEDLRGKPFAVSQNLNSIVGQTATTCFDQVGMDVKKDLQLIHLGNVSQITEALLKGTVAAGVATNYVRIEFGLETKDTWNVLCRGADANPQFHNLYTVGKEWLRENGDLALALVAAELKSARWARANPDEWVKLAMSKVRDLTEEQAKLDYKMFIEELDMWPVNGGIDQTICDRSIATAKKFGVLRKDLTCADIMTRKYQDAALALLGRQ
ncbi:ABC transporter substrate-binding protein [Rhizohabitans arisaemae]|uniref:ABC transporter substrate-binding protein n=1 Tax=Rhizohabitans arisaemae TaxID=2720610 RepID=UPI0024B0F479|nr:ABC transporter substrate-binding protein [Rhizohabitans arisaemae]